MNSAVVDRYKFAPLPAVAPEIVVSILTECLVGELARAEADFEDGSCVR